jgi:hypothetical protein
MTKDQKAFNATAEGQKAMAQRGGRIALLHLMNEAIRRVDPSQAYDRALIDGLADDAIDGMRDSILADYNALCRLSICHCGKSKPLIAEECLSCTMARKGCDR